MSSKNRELKNKLNREYYHRNKKNILEKARINSAQYYQDNKEVFLERAKRSRERYYEKQILRATRSRAKRDGIEFNLTIEDIVIPEKCVFLDIPLTRTQGKGRVWSNASIDRIDNNIGYVKENIQIISLKANVMKSHASLSELIIFSKNCINIYDEQIKEYLK